MNGSSNVVRPMVIVETRSLITGDPGLEELALAAGTMAAVRELGDRLDEAWTTLHQPVVLIVDPRYLGDETLGGDPWEPGEPFRVITLTVAPSCSVEEMIRGFTIATIQEGEPIEVVTGDEALAREADALGGVVVPVADFLARIERGRARARAGRLRAERELADTPGIVAAMIEASEDAPSGPRDEDAVGDADAPPEPTDATDAEERGPEGEGRSRAA